MNCTKCNNPIPDGAKFCPSCGTSYMAAPDLTAPSAPENEKKICQKCGKELMLGARFCSSCGCANDDNAAPAANVSDTAGMGSMSAISLDKPSSADGLVSAMNAAAAPATPVETGVPTPSGLGVPAPTEGGFNSGFTAPAPSFAPSADAADMTGAPAELPFPGTVGGAAAAVKPIKKKGKGKIALIIIAAVVVLLGALAIVFFTNRAGVLSTIMGKSKYAAMVEGNHIKQVTDKIDIPAVANGIKSASGVVQMAANSNLIQRPGYSAFDSYNYGSGGMNQRMSSSSGRGMEFDLSAIEKAYAQMLQSSYGHNSLNSTVKAKVELGDSLKALMNSRDYYFYYDTEEVEEFLNYLNNSTLTYNITATEDAAAFSFGTEGKLTVNAKVLMSGQDMYISLPFISDKAIMIKLDKPAESTVTEFEIKPLELDEKELERIISDIVKIYLENYKNLEIEMENGEISAAGVTVSGKRITAEFSAKELLKLFEEIAEYVANDDYLASKMVEFANSCGAEMTEDDYRDAIMDIFEDAEVDDKTKAKLVITTVINNNGDVLGKSVEMTANKQKASFAYAETKEQSGCEMKFDNVKVSVLNEKENDENGSCTLKVSADGKNFSLSLKYSDVKKAEFCGNEIVTGKFTLSMKLPTEFKDMLDEDSYAAMNGAKLTLSLTSDSPNTLETTVGINAPGYLDASVTETVTVQDSSSDLTPPANTIDLTPLVNGEYVDDKTADELVQLIKDAVNKLEDMGIDTGMSDYLDYLDPSSLTGKMPKSSIENLIDSINQDIEDIYDYADIFSNSDKSNNEDKILDLASLLSKYNALLPKVKNKNYSMTYDEYSEFYNEYRELHMELRDIIYSW